jgi:hypothetical protein
MKKYLSALASIAATSLLAGTFAIGLGESASPSGEVLAFEAITASNAPSITVKCVNSVRETTNAVAQNVSTHTRYDFGLTNWNGSAYVATNTFDRFVYSDWTVLGTNHVAGAVTSTNVVVTNSFTIGVPGRTFFVTNTIFSASAANHYLMATNPATRFLSGAGRIIVTGASAGDRCTLFVK